MMGSGYKQSSPNPSMLGMGSLGNTPGFAAGSQSGSDFDFGTPQSLSMDPLMQADLQQYHGAPIPGYSQAFGNPFDPHMLAQAPLHSGHMQQRGSMSSLADGTSPLLDHQNPLTRITSNPQASRDRHGSVPGSETTSPDRHHVYGGIGENAHANNSNDSMNSVNSQQTGEETGGSATDLSANPPPPWSELKTKAGKDRKRLPLACIACRRKKIRCSGEKPACKHCLRSRIPCVYKITTRKAAPRTDYMAMLDKRLKRMEDRVIRLIPKDEQSVVASTGRAVVKPPLPPAPPKSAASSKKRGAEDAFDEELDEWAHATATRVDVKPEGESETSADPLNKVQDSEEHTLLQEGADRLPEKEIQEHLSEVFFDFVYCQSYPLLHKPSFMRRLAQGQVPPVLMLAVCAISARFSNHPSLRTEPAFLRGEAWASVARDISLKRYDAPNITILIVYIILGLHEFGTCQGGRSWMFGGMAQRMAYALQLHKDLDHDPKSRFTDGKTELTFTDREIRRRTMWSCFLMDRFNSSGTERPIFIGEQYIRAQLPIKESYYQMELTGPTEDLEGNVPNPVEPGSGQTANAQDNMGVTAYLVRLVGIWGKLITYLNLGGKEKDQHPMWSAQSNFSQIQRAAEDWRIKLPECLQFSADNLQNHASEKTANQFLFLHIVYNQTILFMNRFALPLPGSRSTVPKDIPQDFRQEAVETAREAASQISNLVHEAMDYHVVAPFAGYAAFFSSTVHISGAFSHDTELEARSKQNLAWNVKYLTKMKKYWGMFHFMTENLRDLYRRHADAERLGNKNPNRDSGRGIFQYGDWFDRYPHGVSGTDYEEPSADVKKEPGADAVLGQKSDLQTVEEFFSKLAPPSRAVQKEQQPQQRKMAKRRHTKSESKQPAPIQDGQDLKPVTSAPQPVIDDSMSCQPSMHGLPQHQQQTMQFPPDFQQGVNPLLMPPQSQPFMSQLDRQMVLNSYAGVNSSPSSHHQHPHQNHNAMLDPSTQMGFDNYDFAFANSNPQGYYGEGGQWFMPFNMPPPSGIGEDEGNPFGGNFDWPNFGNFGEMPGVMQPTGLTPGRELDLDTGQGEGQGRL